MKENYKRPECATCNSASAKLGCLWPVLHAPERCKLESKHERIGGPYTGSPFDPDKENS